jgi:hypothetical protein
MDSMIKKLRHKTFAFYQYSNPSHTDISWLLYKLRSEDRKELGDMYHGNARKGLEESIANSDECFLVMSSNPGQIDVAGIIGISHLEDGRSSPWFLSTDSFPRISREFSKWAKEMCANNEREWVNYVGVDYTTSQRWLKWLGFDIDSEPCYRGKFFKINKSKI